MTTASRLPLFIDATLATVAAALPNRTLLDGPQKFDASTGSWAIVGGDGTQPDEDKAGGFDHTWAGLGARAQDEGVDVQCALVSWIGDQVPYKTVRDLVCNDMATLETALIANVTQGIPGVLWCQVVSAELFYKNWQQGILARLPFVIHARNRI